MAKVKINYSKAKRIVIQSRWTLQGINAIRTANGKSPSCIYIMVDLTTGDRVRL